MKQSDRGAVLKMFDSERRRERQRRQRQRVVTCCKQLAAFLFSHVGLAGMVIAYSIMGGFLFRALEAPAEQRVKLNVVGVRDRMIDDIWQLATDMAERRVRGVAAGRTFGGRPAATVATPGERENFTGRVQELFRSFQKEVRHAVKDMGWDGNDDMDETQLQWSFAGALLYAVTVTTTIGYGHVAPKTSWGRLLTIVYALVGIPLTFLYLSNIGNFLADCFRLFYKRVCCDVLCCEKCERKRKRQRLKLRRRREIMAAAAEQHNFRFGDEWDRDMATNVEIGVGLNPRYIDTVDSPVIVDTVPVEPPLRRHQSTSSWTTVSSGAAGASTPGDDEAPTSPSARETEILADETVLGQLAIRETDILDDDNDDDDAPTRGHDQQLPVRNRLPVQSPRRDATSARIPRLPRSRSDPKLSPRPPDVAVHASRTSAVVDNDRDRRPKFAASASRSATEMTMTLDRDVMRRSASAKARRAGQHADTAAPRPKSLVTSRTVPLLERSGRRIPAVVGNPAAQQNWHRLRELLNRRRGAAQTEIPSTSVGGGPRIGRVYPQNAVDDRRERRHGDVTDPTAAVAERPSTLSRLRRAVSGLSRPPRSGSEPATTGAAAAATPSRTVRRPRVMPGPQASFDSFVTAPASDDVDKTPLSSQHTGDQTDSSSSSVDVAVPFPVASNELPLIDIGLPPTTDFLSATDTGTGGGFEFDPFEYELDGGGDSDDDLDTEKVTVPVSICLVIIAGYIFAGAVLFTLWEDWDYLTGSYFCFITLSTIGFGDIVPGTDMDKWASHEKLVLCALWLAFGLSLLAMCFNLMQEEVKEKCKWIGKKLGLLKDVEDDT